MTRTTLARLLALTTVLFGMAFYSIGAAIKPGYSSASQFISELNATGTAWAYQLGWFGFVPLGLLFAMFMLAARRRLQLDGASRWGWWLLWSQPLALVMAAFAPCDAGCPADGSTSQTIHSLLGVVTYFAAAAGLVLLANAATDRPSRACLRAAGIAFGVLFVLMLMPELAPVRGLLQRTADALLAGAVLLIGWRLVGSNQA